MGLGLGETLWKKSRTEQIMYSKRIERSLMLSSDNNSDDDDDDDDNYHDNHNDDDDNYHDNNNNNDDDDNDDDDSYYTALRVTLHPSSMLRVSFCAHVCMRYVCVFALCRVIARHHASVQWVECAHMFVHAQVCMEKSTHANTNQMYVTLVCE